MRCVLQALVAMLACGIAADLPAAEPASECPSRLCLSGSDWFLCESPSSSASQAAMPEAATSESRWIPATVPGNVQADLEAAHRLKPLWYGAGDDVRLGEVALKDWWYRKDVAVPADGAHKRLTLVFNGVDHQCDVYVNGRRAGGHAGMYRRVGYDVSDLLRPGKVNRLAVRIARCPPDLVKHTGKPTVIKRYRHDLSDIKSPTNFGLDWGIGIYTLGIWKDVSLEATGPARVEWIQVQPRLSDNFDRAETSIRLEIDSTIALKGNVRLSIAGPTACPAAVLDVDLKQGLNVVDTSIAIDKPRLWWPNGQGEQPLYQLTARLEAADGKPLDCREVRFGIRSVRWVQVAGAKANDPNPAQLVVNGRPVRLMGSNIIPPDLLFGRCHAKALRLLRLAKAAGMNVLRNWGGGINFDDQWYDLADELGIMLQQEFPLTQSGEAWPAEYPEFLAALNRTATCEVKQLRNHPSIIEWTGGNEMDWPGGSRHPVPRLLRAIVAANDDRIFRDSDPVPGWRHGPYGERPETFYRDFNRFSSFRHDEFGCPGPTNLEIWQREIPPASQWPLNPNNPILARHKVFKAWLGDTWLQPRVIESMFGKLDQLETLVEAGQWIAAEELRYAMDELRRKGPHSGGFMSWTLNDPWPNGAGNALVDYDGRPLMNYDFVCQALAPISLSLRYDTLHYDPAAGVKAQLWLCNDGSEDGGRLQWKWTARDCRGGVIGQGSGETTARPRVASQVGVVALHPPQEAATGPIFIELQLRDAQRLLAERLHVFAARGVDAPFRGLLVNGIHGSGKSAQSEAATDRTVTRTKLRCDLVQFSDGPTGGEKALLCLKNTGPMTALLCAVHPLWDDRTDLIVSNNHCTIPPGECREISISAPAGSAERLSLRQIGWRVSCWNADDVIVDAVLGEVPLAVGRRDGMCREYLGYRHSSPLPLHAACELHGRRPAATALPYRLLAGEKVRFVFDADDDVAAKPTELWIDTADQAAEVRPAVVVTVNGVRYRRSLPAGLGMQRDVPAQAAMPAAVPIALPAGRIKAGENLIEVQLENNSWFTWDAMILRVARQN